MGLERLRKMMISQVRMLTCCGTYNRVVGSILNNREWVQRTIYSSRDSLIDTH